MITKENIKKYKEQAVLLVSKMSREEKVHQMINEASQIPRLEVKSYNWWNEALHGVARAGIATVFPQTIGLAATFNEDLVWEVADVTSTEARAKYHEFQRQNDTGTYKGLTFWSPNVNIFRDPRWGRGHETYGEDPYLTSRLGVAFIKGLQGDDPEFLKAAACAKHFCVHSGPEGKRHGFDAKVSKKDLYETYLPAFRACVQEADVEAVMGAYNSVNGEICCASQWLIEDILRQEFGFQGHYVSDCGAIRDIANSHGAAATLAEAAALAVKSGCDLNCGNSYLHLLTALEDHLIEESDLDKALIRLMTTRYKLGIMEGQHTKYDSIPFSANDTKEHRQLALKAAEQSLVLLENDGILPLNKEQIKRVAVIGPNADSRAVLQGNYCGTASRYYTVLDGLRTYLGQDAEVLYAQGSHLYQDRVEACAEPDDRLSEAMSAASYSDVVILCLGLDATLEGEEGDAYNADQAGDKVDLELPLPQKKLLQAVSHLGKPLIVINFSGSAINLAPVKDCANAVIQAWYPGAEGGLALARMIFGEFSPAGRLPVTFYRSADDLPDFCDYSMENRTYRYFDKPILYGFGYGLSYSSFQYSNLRLSKDRVTPGESVTVNIDVTNIGKTEADEVVQLYLKDEETSTRAPKYQLKGFRRIHLKSNDTHTVEFVLTPDMMALVLEDGQSVIEPGRFHIYVDGKQPSDQSACASFLVEEN